ncbi:hypothetical protein EN813_048125 [Mesorhizobium sp. M00.F.Ca.ET.170.01.1.1]|nr:hypothetical protein EN813_048125 [Mesorhizobium sp. M00.F.Ca.ET.170.01.1.1]
MTTLIQLILCGIAPGVIYAVMIVALVLISSARHAATDQLTSASFIDIHDAAGLPFLIVVPAVQQSSITKTPSAKALDAKARRSTGPALKLGGWA